MTRARTGLVVLALLIFPSLGAAAEILRWVDENGVVHFTEAFKIPEKYRSSATPVLAKRVAAPDKAYAPLQIRGHVAIVQARLNNSVYVNLIVDTGASFTVISPAVAKDLGIDIEDDLPTASFQTANGIISAPIVTLDSIEIKGMEVRGLTASVQDISPEVSGLLGLNFLQHFRMDIDHQNALLHLEKK